MTMMRFILITIIVSLQGVYVSGVKLTKTEFWATKTRIGNRSTNFEICLLNGGKLFDLESPKANIFLKKFHLLNPSIFLNKTITRFYIGLRLFGDNFIWDDGCRLANSDTLSFVTGNLSDFNKTDVRRVCPQLRHKPGFTGYLDLSFQVDWRVCDERRRMICEIPTTDECNVTAHDQVTMAGNLYEATLTLHQEDIGMCSAQCDVHTSNGNPCWFYGMKNKTCHLWSAESQPFVSPLQKNPDEGFTIYAKDCIDIIIDNLPNGTIDDNHDICDPGTPNVSRVNLTKFWVTKATVGDRKTVFETCRFNGGRLLDLETPQALICLKKLQQLIPQSVEQRRYFIGLRLFGDNFIWDDGCRSANNDTLSFVTGDLSDYSTTTFRPACFQLRFRRGEKGYLDLNFLPEWARCDLVRRMICEIPTTDECMVVAYEHVIMAENLTERVLTMEKAEVRLCSGQCDVQTANGKPCWFYGMKVRTCHLWFAESQPISSPLQINPVDGFTIYAKDCIDVVIGNRTDVAIGNLSTGAISDNHQTCEPGPQNGTVSTTRSVEDQPTTMIPKTSDMTYTPSTNEEVKPTAMTPGGTSDKSLRGDTTKPLEITNIDSSSTIIPSVPSPSDKVETVTALSVGITEPSAPNLPECECACEDTVKQTAEEKKRFTDEIVGNLTIVAKKTSAYARKYVSAKDDRPSAQKIGGVAAVMLLIVFGTPVLLDLSKVVVFFVKLGLKYHRKKKSSRRESDTKDI